MSAKNDDLAHPLYPKVRDIYLSFPDTTMEMKWGSPHFCVVGKIFGGFGGPMPGRPSCGLKLEMDHADARVSDDPRFTRAPYVGHKGWVTMDLGEKPDLPLLRTLVEESYRLIAPKRSIAKLDIPTQTPKTGSTNAATKKPAPRKAAPKKAAPKKAATKRS